MQPIEEQNLARAEAFINRNGLVCVSGKLQKASLDLEYKHPIILPKNSCISLLIVRDSHKRVAHCGRRQHCQKYKIQASGSLIAMECNLQLCQM